MHLNNKVKDMATFYLSHQNAIRRGLFFDAYQSMRFWKLMGENIKRSHRNLAYTLRNQYDHADAIYKEIRLGYNRMDPDQHQLLRLILTMKCEEMTHYSNDVFSFIVLPFLYRNHIYSPLLALVIFLDMMYTLFDTYMDNTLKAKGLQWLGTYHHFTHHLQEDDVMRIPWLPDEIKFIMRDEICLHLEWKKEKRPKIK